MHLKSRAKWLRVLLLSSIVRLAFSFEFNGIPNLAVVGISFSAQLNRDSSDLADFVLGYFVNDSTSFSVIQSFESENATVIPFQFTPTGPGVYVMGIMPTSTGDLISESSNFNVLSAQLPLSSPQTLSSSSSLSTSTSTSTSTPEPGTTTSQAQAVTSSLESLSSSSTFETSISGSTSTGIASDTSFTSGTSTTNPSKSLSSSQPMTTTTSQGSTAPSGPNTLKLHKKLDLTAIIGGLVGGFIILVIGVGIIMWKQNQRRRHTISPFTEDGSHPTWTHPEQKLKRPLFKLKSSGIGMIADPALHNLNDSNGRKSRNDPCRNARQRRSSPLKIRSEFGLENTASPIIGTIGLGRVGGGESAELFEQNERADGNRGAGPIVDELELPPEYYSVYSTQ